MWQPKKVESIEEPEREDLGEKDNISGLEIDTKEVNVVLIPAREQRSPECIEAKEKELQAFLDFQVFTKVDD